MKNTKRNFRQIKTLNYKLNVASEFTFRFYNKCKCEENSSKAKCIYIVNLKKLRLSNKQRHMWSRTTLDLLTSPDFGWHRKCVKNSKLKFILNYDNCLWIKIDQILLNLFNEITSSIILHY